MPTRCAIGTSGFQRLGWLGSDSFADHPVLGEQHFNSEGEKKGERGSEKEKRREKKKEESEREKKQMRERKKEKKND